MCWVQQNLHQASQHSYHQIEIVALNLQHIISIVFDLQSLSMITKHHHLRSNPQKHSPTKIQCHFGGINRSMQFKVFFGNENTFPVSSAIYS